MVSYTFWIGEWRAEPLTHRLVLGERVVKLEPKAMAVLVCLANKPGEVVTRETLMAEVWPETMVGEEALNNAVSKLRRTFGDKTRDPSFIQTVPKVGYCLIAPVRRETAPELSVVTPAKSNRIPWAIGVAVLLVAIVAWSLRKPTVADAGAPVFRPDWITALPGTEQNVTLDKEGRLAAFAWDGPERNNYDIYVTQISDAAPRRLTQHPAFEDSPSFSPDGRTLVFQRFHGPDRAIFTVPVEGGEPRRLADCMFSVYADVTFSPDGRQLAFSGRLSKEERFGLMILAMDSLIQRKITEPQGTLWGDHDPAFSPDGGSIAFVRSISEGIQDLFLIDADGGNERRLTRDARNIHGVAWLDEDTLLYATNRAGVPALWQLDISSLKSKPFSNQFWQVAKPAISGNRRVLAFQQANSDMNVWKWDIKREGEPVPFLRSTRWDLHPSFAPNGTDLAFTSNRSGSFEIWTRPVGEGTARRLTHFNGPFTGTPRYAPDGLRLVFDSRPEGHADIYVIPRTGGPATRLTTHESDDLAPNWSQDGAWIYFASARSGNWQVWKIPDTGGTPQQVTQAGGYAAKEGPDGHLYVTRFEEPGVWRLSKDGGEPQQICDDLAPVDWGSWEITEVGLFSIRRSQGETQLLQRPLSGGEPTVLRSLPWSLPARDPAFTVSPDSDLLLFGRVDRFDADILSLDLSHIPQRGTN